MILEIMTRKRIQEKILGESSDEVLSIIWSVYSYYINSVHIQCKDSLFALF